MTALLYGTVVLCWSFTWYAIHLQLGVVPPEVSIVWRFVLSAAIMWAILFATGRLKRAPLRQHIWFAGVGLCMFGLNFLSMYNATFYIASGVVSVVFTLATAFNSINQWLFRGVPPAPRVLAGTGLGIAGTALLFGDSLLHLGSGGTTAIGLGLAVCGTYVFSVGNFVTPRAASGGVDLPNALARGMTWGAVLLAGFAAARGLPFTIETTPVYLGSLVYLALVGTVIASFAYFTLLGRIGPERVAYTAVLFPVLALGVSTVLEGFRWTPWALAGLPLILIGNVVIFTGRKVAKTA